MLTKKIARLIAHAAEEIQAIDLIVLNLKKLTSFTDYFIICSGRSERQVQSIADAVEEVMRKNKLKVLGLEGYEIGQWVLVDCGDVVVHIFHQDIREYYSLEKLWSDAPRVEV